MIRPGKIIKNLFQSIAVVLYNLLTTNFLFKIFYFIFKTDTFCHKKKYKFVTHEKILKLLQANKIFIEKNYTI